MRFFLSCCLFPLLATAAPLTPVRFQLDYKLNAQFAGLIEAQRLGLYRDAGLEVKIVPDPGTRDIVKEVVSGKALLACADATVLLSARDKGAPIKALGVMFQKPPLTFMALKTSGIRSPRDFKGKRIGIREDGVGPLELVLKPYGLTGKDMTLVPLPYELTALTSGKVEVMQGFTLDELAELESHGHPVVSFPAAKYGYRGYAQVYFTSEKSLATQRPVLEKFLTASRGGWKHVVQHPETTVDALLSGPLKGTDRAFLVRALTEINDTVTAQGGVKDIGGMRLKTWKEIETLLRSQGLLKRPGLAEELWAPVL